VIRESIVTDFGEVVAERMRAEHRVLAARWFERLLTLIPVDAREVFPSESLLDHIPALILEISEYVRHPAKEAIAANTAILDKARELGALRHDQRASLHQVLREYQVLDGVLVTFVIEEIERLDAEPPAADSIALVSRLNQAINVLSQATVEAFVTLYTNTIAEQKERLEQFTRMAAHEWRQPLSTLQVGISLLRRFELDVDRRERTLAAVERNVQSLVDLTVKLETVARVRDGSDNVVVQQVEATAIVQEAARQLREMADSRGVDIRISATLPTLTVDVGRLELALVNLLSNAIKYADPEKPERHVEVCEADAQQGWCRLEVRDNGIGIPQHALDKIFKRFERGHSDREERFQIGGLGLGLSIADDCVLGMGGHIDVDSTEGRGTVFAITLPLALPRPSDSSA
jgi:signal transduction histidine kinase